ncbi:MAG: hypothetical protein E6I87_09365 [Chloroflexi bacterium]|nr:MAG: hypothetical protein E6I87_09365 [Chloroflexota bacterium]
MPRVTPVYPQKNCMGPIHQLRDLIHGPLEDSQLFFVESRHKEIGYPTQVDRRRLRQAGHARIGQYDHDTTCVCIGVGSTNKALVNETSIDDRRIVPSAVDPQWDEVGATGSPAYRAASRCCPAGVLTAPRDPWRNQDDAPQALSGAGRLLVTAFPDGSFSSGRSGRREPH